MKKLIKNIASNIVWNETNRLILQAVCTIGSVTLFVKGFAAVKESMIAYAFGTSDVMDAFIVAFLIPNFLITILSTSFNGAFIPNYLMVENKEGMLAAKTFNTNVCIFLIIFLVATILLSLIAANPLITFLAPGFSGEKLQMSIKMLIMLSPLLLLGGISTFLMALLNAKKHFFMFALIPIFTPAMITLCILIWFKSLVINALILGTLLGAALELICLISVLYYYKNLHFIFKIHTVFDKNLRKFIEDWWPLLLTALTSVGIVVVDISMSSFLNAHAISALNYANKIIMLPLTLAMMAFGPAIIPYVAKLNADNQPADILRLFRHYTTLLMLTTIPCTVILIMLAPLIVDLLFLRGAFTKEDAHTVATILRWLLIYLPFYICSILNVRILSSLMMNKTLLFITLVSIFLSGGLNWILMQSMGVYGIALSTSIVYIVSWAISHSVVRSRLRVLVTNSERTIKTNPSNSDSIIPT